MNYLLNYIKIEKISKNGCPILDTLVFGRPIFQGNSILIQRRISRGSAAVRGVINTAVGRRGQAQREAVLVIAA